MSTTKISSDNILTYITHKLWNRASQHMLSIDNIIYRGFDTTVTRNTFIMLSIQGERILDG